MDDGESRKFPISEHMHFQSASWIAERLGWAALAAIAVLALAGVFSEGYLSHQTLAAPGSPLALEYERFQRISVTTRFAARVSRPAGDETRLHLSPPFLETYEIQSMQPRPARASANPDGLDLFFERPESGDLAVVFWARPRRIGLADLSLAADHGEALRFSVLIYP